MFSEEWATKSKAMLAAAPFLAAATSVALNIVVLAFVIQLESKIDAALNAPHGMMAGCANERDISKKIKYNMHILSNDRFSRIKYDKQVCWHPFFLGHLVQSPT